MVTLSDIGEDRAALFCLTDRAACCRRSDTGASGHGVWLLPGGSPVVQKSGAVAGMFYRSRGARTVVTVLSWGVLECSPVIHQTVQTTLSKCLLGFTLQMLV